MTVAKVKPRFRGWSHQFAFVAALFAGSMLAVLTRPGLAQISVTVFVVSMCWLLGVSALYHRPMWRLDLRAKMARLDHASIFLLIAGTYTPFCLLVLQPKEGHVLLACVWVGALAGMVVTTLWTKRPRVVSSAIYIALGLSAMAYIRVIFAALDAMGFALFALGGAVYIVGAVVYAFRWPNPNPAVFGYHEVFHLFVVVACAMHFWGIARIVGIL